MKVLIINQHISDALGGSEMQCDLIAKGLFNRGHQVVYGVVGRNKEKYPDIPYKAIPLKIEKDNELAKLLKEENPDVIYWRFNKKYLLKAVLENQKLNIPFVFAISHINDITKFAYKAPPRAKSFRKKIKNLKKIIIMMLDSARNYRAFRYVDAVTAQLSSQYNKLPVKKQRIIWNSVTDKKEVFNWSKKYCIWVANIKAPKRPEIYIKLAEIMAKRSPDTDFLMIGSVNSDSYKKILNNVDSPNFYYLGAKTPEFVNAALEKAECLIHTCKPEGFPNNIIQSWVHGCPVISLEYDPDCLINKQQLGFVSGTFERMVEDVEEILINKSLREEIGKRAKIFAQNVFSKERMVSEIEEFLQEVIHDKR